MSALECKELYFLIDSAGALSAYQEKDASWAGLLAFSSEDRARDFCRDSGSEAREIVALPVSDRASLVALIGQVKKRAIRHLLLDLDYRHGRCFQVEFEGDGFGEVSERQFVPPAAG
ncbi:MAG: hypothetical protein ABSD31_15215 [Candidatus Binataceae bacterium]